MENAGLVEREGAISGLPSGVCGLHSVRGSAVFGQVWRSVALMLAVATCLS